MEIDKIIGYIGSVGFPIVACGCLFFIINKTINDLRKSVDDLTKAVTDLIKK